MHDLQRRGLAPRVQRGELVGPLALGHPGGLDSLRDGNRLAGDGRRDGGGDRAALHLVGGVHLWYGLDGGANPVDRAPSGHRVGRQVEPARAGGGDQVLGSGPVGDRRRAGLRK